MPTYQYVCTECGGQLEAVQKFTDESLTVHEDCGGRLRKVFSPVGIVFKGSGFYRTDSRGSGPSGSSSSEGERLEGERVVCFFFVRFVFVLFEVGWRLVRVVVRRQLRVVRVVLFGQLFRREGRLTAMSATPQGDGPPYPRNRSRRSGSSAGPASMSS